MPSKKKVAPAAKPKAPARKPALPTRKPVAAKPARLASKPAPRSSKGTPKAAAKPVLKKGQVAKPLARPVAKPLTKPLARPIVKGAAKPTLGKAPSRQSAKAAPPVRIPVRVMMPKVAPFTRPAALQSGNGHQPPKFMSKAARARAAKGPAATMMPPGPRAMVKGPSKPAPAPAPKPVSVSTAVGLPAGIKPYKVRKGEPYMNEPQREHFTRILQAWKRSLMEEVDRTVHHMQDEAANFPDPNDRATQESEFSLELRTRDRERKLIKKIDEAIGRITLDEYGFCEDCGAEIGVQRLEARSTATQCIDCKTLDEIREKQMGG